MAYSITTQECSRCGETWPATGHYFFTRPGKKHPPLCIECHNSEIAVGRAVFETNTDPGITKVCSVCGKEKPATTKYFRKHAHTRYGVTAACKDCSLKYHRKYERDNRDAVLESHRNWQASRSAMVASIKMDIGCVVCGENRHPAVLDFHHVDPSKKTDNIASMKSCSVPVILNEISNCVVLCASCHRLVHNGVISIE